MFDLRLPFSSVKLFREDMRPHRCAKFQQRMQIESGRRQHDSLCSVECDVLHTSSAGCRVTQWNFALALSTAGRLVFQTKSKRGCFCGEDRYGASYKILRKQCTASRNGDSKRPPASILSRYSRKPRKFTAQEFLW